MKWGIHYSLGVRMNPRLDDYVRVDTKAEELGYNSVWLGDHVVIPEKIEAAYPYRPGGSLVFRAVCPSQTPLLSWQHLGPTRKQ
jgi:hypothetical protein